MNRKRLFLLLVFALGLVIADQATKLLVHVYMEKGMGGQIVLLGDWLKLHYTTNPGMAFGIRLGDEYGKLFLTSFRILAMFGIGYYLYTLVKKQHPKGLQICVAMVLGGAVGNLVDSVFYGVLLDNAPAGSPYKWFHGQVIDMIYVDIWEGYVVDWVPFFGGQYYAFWPIFNLADSSIFVGIFAILLFQKRFFAEEEKKKSRLAQ